MKKFGKQGEGATLAFKGESGSETVKKLYSESAEYFARIIESVLPPPNTEPYELLDVGTFGGELLTSFLKEIDPEYIFITTGIDTDIEALENNNIVDKKIVCNAAEIPLADKQIDVALVRYVLQWNNLRKQEEILKELKRLCNKAIIIQHAGANNLDEDNNISEWQKRVHDLVLGSVDKIKRPEACFSSVSQIEDMLNQLGFKFQRLQDRKLVKLSDVFIEKYKLTEEESEKVKEVLGDEDYIQQTTWVIICD